VSSNEEYRREMLREIGNRYNTLGNQDVYVAALGAALPMLTEYQFDMIVQAAETVLSSLSDPSDMV